MSQLVIDSDTSLEKALAQNPQSPAPKDILQRLRLVSVEYLGFDQALHQGQIVMHEAVIEDVKKFFDLALRERFPFSKVIPISDARYGWDDERSCADNNSSGYNYRLIAGSTKISNHARGLAFDISPVQNPYIRYDEDLNEIFRFPPTALYNEKVPGTLTPEHPLVLLMKKLGWEWGGNWTPPSGRIDYQHFQKELPV